MAEICTVNGSAIFVRCDCNLPQFFCGLANISGYCSTVIWFIILVPQLVRNVRHSSVRGISPAWAICNFSAAMNNAFFVFKTSHMPWYIYVSAIYMPVLEAILLLQFVIYTPHTLTKMIVQLSCFVMWSVIVMLQTTIPVYGHLEWISIVLWSAETIPQVFLNMRRRSTYGLSNLSIAIGAWGKITDFMENYLLVMPMQYVVMAYFSSTIAQVGTIQVLYYWNQIPAQNDDGDEVYGEVIRRDNSPKCNFVRYLGMTFFGCVLVGYTIAFVIRTREILWIIAPVCLYGLFIAYYVRLRFFTNRPTEAGQRIFVWRSVPSEN